MLVLHYMMNIMASENKTGTNLQETPSQDGVFPVKGMRGLSQQSPSDIDQFNKGMEQLHWGRSVTRDVTPIGGAIGNLVPTDFGESKYDTELAVQDVLSGDKTLNQLRAQEQSGWTKVGNGVLGALSLAGTTFVRGTLGLLYGSGQALNEGRFSALWDNDVNNAMDSWDSFVDEQAPIYLTKYEEEHPWKTLFSAGNLSNSIIKNAGFMIGAALSGQVYSGAIQSLGIANKIGSGVASINTATRTSNAAKAGYELAKATMQKQAAGAGTQALVSTMSAIGEGSFEAANNSKEYEESQVQTRRAEFEELMSRPETQMEVLRQAQSMVSLDDFTVIAPEGQMVVDYEGHRQAVQEAYNSIVENRWGEIRAEIHDKALKMGNADMLMNIPILAVSNWIQFGRLFRGGFKANKTAAKIKGNFTDGFRTPSGKVAKAKKLGAALLSPASEGFEEMNQAAVAEGASIWTASELDSFIDDRYNPDSERETSGFLSSMWNGLVDTYSDPDNWLEFTYGAMMGAIPMPIARRKSNGRIGVDLNWELLNKVRDSKEAMAEAQELTDYLNSRVNDPKFQSNWNALVANTNMQAKMNRTIADPFNFKNYEHRQAVHDLIAIDKAGKLDLFKEQLQDWASKSNTEQFIDDLKDASTDENGVSWMDGMSSEEIYDTYQRNVKDLLNTVEFFGQASRNIRTTYGDIFTDDALDEMVYIRTQIQNWQDRANAIRESVGHKVVPSLLRVIEGVELSNNLKDLLNWIGSSSQDLAVLKEGDFDSVSKFLEETVNNSDIVDKNQALRDLTDLIRISVSISNGIRTYNKHISNPESLNKKIEDKKAERSKEIKKGEDAETITTVSQGLNNATTYSEMVDALSSQELPDLANIDLEGAQVIEEAKSTVQKVETARRVASNKAQSTKNSIDRAAQSMIEMVTEQMPGDAVLDPNSVMEVYGPVLEEAIANGNIDVPESLENTFTPEVLDAVEESLRLYQEEQQRLNSVPDIDIESVPDNLGDIDLEGATKLEELGTSTLTDTKLPENVEAVDKPMPEITVREAQELAKSPEVRGSSRSILYTAVPEIHKEAAKFVNGENAIITPDSDNWEKWEKAYDSSRVPTNFKEIYQRLQAFGAFDYLRSHVITPGTEVFYVADTGFKGPNPEKFGIPIFFAIKDSATKELQIIGAAPSYKLTNLDSLKEIGQSLEEKSKDITEPGLLISGTTTRVSVVNDGTFHVTPQIKTVDRDFLGDANISIGVVVNGQVYNKDGSVSRNLISTSVGDFTKYNGRPVLLVRATSGRYKLMPLRTKKLGVDISINETNNPIIQQITKAVDRLVRSTTPSEDKQAVLDLKASLYLPDVYIRPEFNNIGAKQLIFTIKGEDGKYHSLIDPVTIVGPTTLEGGPSLTREVARDNILQALASLEPMFQVSARLLENNSAYEGYYIDSGVLYTDLQSPKIYNTWMIFEDSAKSPAEERTELKEALSPSTEISLGRNTYRSSPEGWRSSDGSLVVDPRTVAALNRKYMADNVPKAAIPKPPIQTMNTFGVGRVGTPRVRTSKQESITEVSKSQKDLENTNNLLIFAKLDEKQKESIISKGISEADFNAMSRDQQDKIIECYS